MRKRPVENLSSIFIRSQVLRGLVYVNSQPCLSYSATSTMCAITPVETINPTG